MEISQPSGCSKWRAIGGMLVAFVVTLEVESILLLHVQAGTWLAQFIDDASTHGPVYVCTLPPAVLAAWGCGAFSRRLALSVLASAWLYLIWQIAMQIHGRRVVGIGEVGLLLSFFTWALAGLLVLRWKLGIGFECDCAVEVPKHTRWQFPLREVFFWTFACGVTLGVGRYAFPPQNWELEWSLVQHALRLDTQFNTVLHFALILPLPLALVFRWRWLPAAALVSIAALVIGIPYYAWMGNATMLRVIQSIPYLAARFYFTSWPIQVLPLLIALRLAGCRLRPAGTDAVLRWRRTASTSPIPALGKPR